jgi:hypothetical protein
MNEILELLKIIVPAAIVAYGSFSIIKAFLARQESSEVIKSKALVSKEVLPLRLQAYERLAIYLERISLNSLILRLNDPSFNAKEFHMVLVSAIREEYSHNLSQQIYVSQQVWDSVKSATEETIGIINYSAQKVDREAPSIELAKRIFDSVISEQKEPISAVLEMVKKEVQENF